MVFEPEKVKRDTNYNVSFPALPEIATFGTSIEDARFMAQDALELVILHRLETGEILPRDKKPTRVPKNAKLEEVVVTVSHKVEASPADYVKNAFFKS